MRTGRRKTRHDWIVLPPGFDPVDATIEEVMSYRRESLT
jgi:hypothetical protein